MYETHELCAVVYVHSMHVFVRQQVNTCWSHFIFSSLTLHSSSSFFLYTDLRVLWCACDMKLKKGKQENDFYLRKFCLRSRYFTHFNCKNISKQMYEETFCLRIYRFDFSMPTLCGCIPWSFEYTTGHIKKTIHKERTRSNINKLSESWRWN